MVGPPIPGPRGTPGTDATASAGAPRFPGTWLLSEWRSCKAVEGSGGPGSERESRPWLVSEVTSAFP